MKKIIIILTVFCIFNKITAQKFSIDVELGQSEATSWPFVYEDKLFSGGNLQSKNQFYWNWGLGASYEISRSFYLRANFDFNNSDYKTIGPLVFTEAPNVVGHINSYRINNSSTNRQRSEKKQLASSLILGYNIPKTRIYTELGFTQFYNYAMVNNFTLSNHEKFNNAPDELLFEIDVNELTLTRQMTYGFNAGFGFLIDKRFFGIQIPEKLFAKFGTQFYGEKSYQVFEETKFKLGFYKVSIQGTFGLRIF